ncbi:glycosyltransferase family 4 protein [Winogradskyella pulchriflava]|uniref:Glycosyltransferase family 4 protein n=1 Tax=Winogradskyella pulchriflava TaxID=1110688 RepID=A0ABV6QBQ5_9FLAO
MHICFITNEYPKQNYAHGGIGSFIYTMSHQLVKIGHQVSVVGINVYTKIDESQIDNGVSVFRVKPRVIKGLTWYLNNQAVNKKINEIHKQSPIDIIETAELGLAFIKKIKSIKYIIRLHGGHHFFAEAENRKVSWWKGFQEKKSFKRADGFIAVSKFVKTHTSKYLSYHNKPIEIIMSPINLEIFKPKPDIKIEENTIMFAGTVCDKKGVEKLIKAMPKVLQLRPEVNLYIYGRDWFFNNGRSYVSFLKEDIISNLGKLKAHIHFMGAVPITELVNKYASAEVCVFPSLMETQGLVAPEAMAVGKLVVFSELGPGTETVEHKKTGLLCNPYDEDDIADTILWALNHKTEANKIAENARKFVLSNFNMDIVISKNLEFYNFVINQ